MALTDIVFDQTNTHAAERGDVGIVQDYLLSLGTTTLFKSGVLQRWNDTTMQWEVFPLKYFSGDGWV